MRLFRCQVCGGALHFEDTRCACCGSDLGFLPGPGVLSALERDGRAWRALAQPEGRFRHCANAGQEACNWLVPARSSDALCRSCRLNRAVPDLGIPENLVPWRRWETAKHRLVYSLLKLRLLAPDRAQDAREGLAFVILADRAEAGPPETTLHADGVIITLALADAEENEPDPTLLDRLRHASGHAYWTRLVRDAGRLETFRALFGDEQPDRAAALDRHRAQGPPPGWEQAHVSPLAAAHPLEDFAETWACYLQMLDLLEMLASLGLAPRAQAEEAAEPAAGTAVDPYTASDVAALIGAWGPAAYALNALGRCRGMPDCHPVPLAPPVVAKLGFVHALVRGAGQPRAAPGGGRGGMTAATAAA